MIFRTDNHDGNNKEGGFMSLNWDETMLLGIDEIDNQHKTIIEEFSRLSEALQSNNGKEQILETIAFLDEYAQKHFTLEDGYMVKYAYPEIEVQRNEHGEFTRDVRALKNRIEQEGVSREIAFTVSRNLIRWIIQHISKHDREMVSYVVARMASEHDAQSG